MAIDLCILNSYLLFWNAGSDDDYPGFREAPNINIVDFIILDHSA